jgi:hypothetical protein
MWRVDDALVRVHGSWSGWRSAEVRLIDLDDVHWSQPPGAPHPLIHAFVPSARLPKGDLTPDGDPGSMRRRILVCVLKRHTIPAAYGVLVRRADARRAAAQFPPAVDTGGSGDFDFRG